MDEAINIILLEDLNEADNTFNNIISEMKENNVSYNYEEIIYMEKNSYQIADSAINKMFESQQKYNLLYDDNSEFFEEERRITLKYILLYFVSIIMIKVFAKTLSADKINEIWYALLGMTLGTINTRMLYKNVYSYRNDSKEKRELISNLQEMNSIYDDNFEIARREVDYIYSLNRNLQEEIPSEKIFIKK